MAYVCILQALQGFPSLEFLNVYFTPKKHALQVADFGFKTEFFQV